MNNKQNISISFDAIYSKNINFLIGSGASFGIAPTLELKIQDASTGKAHTVETLGKYFEDSRKEAHLTTLLMYYYINCIKPILELDNEQAYPIQKGVIENYKQFLKSIATLLNRKRADKQCNIFTTNYDNCFVQAIDKLYSKGDFNLNLNDGAKGFSKNYLSARNFNTTQYETSPFRQHKSEIPQINLIHLHGSVYWKKERGLAISVDYKNKVNILDKSDEIEKLIADFKSMLSNENASVEQLQPFISFNGIEEKFLNKYNELPIVNPTKWKFHETVFEEHYYQMLRYMSYELEKENSVLIVFGFSFADEHILNIVKRALANPKLCVYICCFTEAEEIEIRAKFSEKDSIRYISLSG